MTALKALLNWRSLRWQIAGLAAAAASVVALVLGVLVHQSATARAETSGRSRAVTALQALTDTYLATGQLPGYAEDAPPDLRELALATPDEAVTWYDTTRPAVPWMWAARDARGDVLAVRVDMGTDVRNVAAQDRFVVKTALVTVAVVIVAAALLSELVNRRLRRVAGTARTIAGGDLDARINARGGDEVADIGAAVDTMAAALQNRLVSEQRFTADVAHELRTPLTGLVTAAELLPDGEATDLVRDRVRVLRGLVEDLLEISRLDAGAERAELTAVPLGELVEQTVARSGLTARVEVATTRVVWTDPRRAERIVANLVTNAVRHGAAPVEVTVAGTAVSVRDHGPGFPAALLAEGPQRFRTGTAARGRGHGLGLTIALGQARVIGATLDFGAAPGGGALATVRFPVMPD
ncbi:sensor histidine kinase [Amycolatopsis tucumanensis]|uniref:histidine kinase n=1 Tax=Amycolatopsis tucumanensis TaxID=401106 RepID=A0ABP7J9R1_9PSEU|nr:HAMP domain-containing sensor histidine kinase [Amycolatopsis tucumanensis]MCF6421798.1 HAMP domain-containing histidine kinase [Amycolatopsis tucumanensis]